MPVPGFLSSIADKAQNAIKDTPLSQHMPGGRPASPSGKAAGSGSGEAHSKNHTLDQLQHHFRTFQQAYTTSAGPVQRIVTASKGVALDFETVNRDAQASSKELYTWGQNDEPDIRDVSDRLAFLNFVSGSLANTLALRLDASRAPFKQLRDKENALAPRRAARTGFQSQIGRLEAGQEKGYEKRIGELRAQLAKAEKDDQPAEKEIEILKRRALKESEQIKWQAFREYGEKLSLLSQASELMLEYLPSVPGSYSNSEETGTIRATLQHALDNWTPGQTTLASSQGAKIDRSHTRSFGETHARELSSIHPGEPSTTTLPVTPPAVGQQATESTDTLTPKSTSVDRALAPAPVPLQGHTLSASRPLSSNKPTSPVAIPSVSSGLSAQSSTSTSINTAALNNAPAQIPSSTSPPVGGVLSPIESTPIKSETTAVPSVTPTVAETGVPVAASVGGPGPSSGSLKDLKSSAEERRGSASSLAGASSSVSASGTVPTIPEEPRTPAVATDTAPKFESAEDEKKRLQREEREKLLHGDASTSDPPPTFESAEEEKKRLEREERERILSGSMGANPEGGKPGDDGPPPYQDF